MPNNLRTLEQIKAEFAFNCAKNALNLGVSYKNYVKKLPMLIKSNGLGPAFAFMFSKKDKDEGKYWKEIGKNIYDWLVNNNIINRDKVQSFDDLVKYLTTINSIEYRALTNEVLSFLIWLKRFADGLIQGE